MQYIQLLSAFLILFVFAYCYINFAKRYNILDVPNNRSSHIKPTIRGGGILFLFGLFIYFIWSNFQYPYFVIGTALIAILSFIDDVITLSPRLRLPFQIIAVILVFYQIGFDNFYLWSYLPLIIIAVGFINIFNFMDGINAITALSSLVVIGSFYFLNQLYPAVDNELLFIVIISVLVFSLFNIRKRAIMFAGDIGSITIAMILLFIALKFVIVTKSPLVLFFYSVYFTDSILTIFYRIYKKEKLHIAHRHHIYQKLVDNFNYSHLQVSAGFASLQAIINLLIIWIFYSSPIENHIIFGLVISIIPLLLYIYFFRKNEKK